MTLVLRDVTKRYRNGTAVDAVGFTVPEGSVFGLLGPNGAGKTTTIRMIMDIVRPDAGELTWRGTELTAVPRRELGYLPEERGLYPDMPVAEQVTFFGEISGLSHAEAVTKTERWLERMDITEHAAKPVSELSKGNQQKVQLLAAIVHEPSLLILDEPFSGLDPVNHRLLREVIAELRDAGTTIVLSTHDMEQVESLCDSVALVHRSRLVFAGTVADLRARHQRRAHVKLVFRGDDESLQREVALQRAGTADGDWVELDTENGTSPDALLRQALRHGEVREVRTVAPTMREIFLAEIGQEV
jgi:ABC-2 type transport system ATP-binding protein